MSDKDNNAGAWISLLIGLPLGLLSFFIVGCLFIIPPFSLVFLFIGGGVFGQPLLFLIGIPVIFASLLWIGGQRIAGYIGQGHSLITISRMYTTFVAIRLFAAMLVLFIAGITIFPSRGLEVSKLLCIGVAAGLLLLAFKVVNFYTTHTVGLLVVFLTKKRLGL